jgi:hypothetical protein
MGYICANIEVAQLRYLIKIVLMVFQVRATSAWQIFVALPSFL